MKFRITLICLLLIAACVGGVRAQGIKSGVQLTSKEAPWVLRVLGQELDIANVKVQDEASAYFMMTSETTKLNVSVWIEPAKQCKTAETCRDLVLSTGNPEWGKYQDLKKGTLGEASYFEFYRPDAQGQPLKVQDMYAEFVKDGYWVDVHISKVLYDPKKDHALFETLVKAVSFISKTDRPESEFETMLGKSAQAAANWLALWDQGKCAETYAALQSITRAQASETSWTEYCGKVKTRVGKLLDREMIAASFVNSLPPKTDRPVAIMVTYSDFVKSIKSFEMVALLLEKDGRWVVTNYLTR